MGVTLVADWKTMLSDQIPDTFAAKLVWLNDC